MTKNTTNEVVHVGTCVYCMNENLPLHKRGDELMCDECHEHFDEEEEMNEHDQEASEKYMAQEAEEWLPEHGFDDEEDD